MERRDHILREHLSVSLIAACILLSGCFTPDVAIVGEEHSWDSPTSKRQPYGFINGAANETNIQRAVDLLAAEIARNMSGIADSSKAFSPFSRQGDGFEPEDANSLFLEGAGALNQKDYDKALSMLKRSAEQGDGRACFGLALMYADGMGVKENYGTAEIWLRRASEHFEPARKYLTKMHEIGIGVKLDDQLAVGELKTAASRGNVISEFALGVLLVNSGNDIDQTQAGKWFWSAAQADYAPAQVMVGQGFLQGKLGYPKDINEAFKWMAKAANAGYASGQSFLGVFYLNGLGVERNVTEALKWVRRGAEQGDVFGQNYLGAMFYGGDGIAKDYHEAMRWFGKAAEQGDPDALYRLGVMREYGVGCETNVSAAIEWYRKAAEAGHADARDRLKAVGCKNSIHR